jgi:hypothetical protein
MLVDVVAASPFDDSVQHRVFASAVALLLALVPRSQLARVCGDAVVAVASGPASARSVVAVASGPASARSLALLQRLCIVAGPCDGRGDAVAAVACPVLASMLQSIPLPPTHEHAPLCAAVADVLLALMGGDDVMPSHADVFRLARCTVELLNAVVVAASAPPSPPPPSSAPSWAPSSSSSSRSSAPSASPPSSPTGLDVTLDALAAMPLPTPVHSVTTLITRLCALQPTCVLLLRAMLQALCDSGDAPHSQLLLQTVVHVSLRVSIAPRLLAVLLTDVVGGVGLETHVLAPIAVCPSLSLVAPCRHVTGCGRCCHVVSLSVCRRLPAW